MLEAESERLAAGIELVPFLEHGGPFGPAWAAHPFASPAMTVGYKLREPDVTRALARFMGPAGGRRGFERAVSFLRSLAELSSHPVIDAALTDTTRLAVVAEHQVAPQTRLARSGEVGRSAANRIDLLFEWPYGTAGQRAVVVVEAKLGSTIGDHQLRPYREEARRRAKGGPVALILLTAWTDAAERRSRAWKPVRWFQLLRRWEGAIAEAGDDDPEFARVRAHVWSFVLSSRGWQH